MWFVNSWRVDKRDLMIRGRRDTNNSSSRGLRFVADDGHLMSNDLVEQGALTDVWLAEEGDIPSSEARF